MSTETTTLRISGAADVLATVAMRLGFHPKDSLVLISLRESHRVGLITRVDLADAAQCAASVVEHLRRDGAASCIVVAYSDSTQPRTDLDLIRVYLLHVNVLGSAGIRVHEFLHVGPERFVSLTCDDGCCPEEGWPVDALKDTLVAAEYVARGRVALDSREALLGDLTPADDKIRAAVEQRASGRVSTPAQTLARWRRSVAPSLLGKPRPLSTTTGSLLAGLGDPVARDAVMLALIPDSDAAERYVKGDDIAGDAMSRIFMPGNAVRPDPDTVEAARATLLHLARCATGARAAIPLTLLGFLAWWTGDFVPAGEYIDRALKADPRHRLALLIARHLSRGVPPGWVQEEDRD